MNKSKIKLIIMDEGVSYDCKDKKDVVKAILEEYDRHDDISITKLLNNLEVSGLSVQDVVDIFITVSTNNIKQSLNLELFVQDNHQLCDMADYIIYGDKIVKDRMEINDIDIIVSVKNNIIMVNTSDNTTKLVKFDQDKLDMIKSLGIYNIDDTGFITKKEIHKLIGVFGEIDGPEGENMEDFIKKYGIVGSNTADEGDIEIYYDDRGNNYAILHNSITYHGRNLDKDINNTKQLDCNAIKKLIAEKWEMDSDSISNLTLLFDYLVFNKIIKDQKDVEDIINHDFYGEIKEDINSYVELKDYLIDDTVNPYRLTDIAKDALQIVTEDQLKNIFNKNGWFVHNNIAILLDEGYYTIKND